MNRLEIEETHTIYADECNWIKLRGTKVVDICVGDGHAGCLCSICRPERYNEERGEILCKAKDSCCNSVLRKICGEEKEKNNDRICSIKINDMLANEIDTVKKKCNLLFERIEALKAEREKLREEAENLKKEKDKWENRYYSAQMDLISERNLRNEGGNNYKL